MRRRAFLRTSAGLVAMVVSEACWSVTRHEGEKRHVIFRAYRPNRTVGKLTCVTTDGKYLVTDAYPNEPVALPNGEVPIRLADLEADDERNICTIYTLGKGKGVLRLDPHPAWSRDYKQVCFNGAPEGKRRVFIADLTTVL